MKKLYIIITVLIAAFSVQAQQEGQFTQFYYAQQAYNPAYVGVREVPTLSVLYRQQWIGYEGGPSTIFAGFNSKFLSDRVGIGIGIMTDNIGIQKTWKASMAYSYELKINEKNSINFGFQGSMKNYRFDFSDPSLFILNQGDNSVLEGMQTSEFTGNFGFGIYASLGNVFVGASVPNFYPNELGFNNDRQIVSALEAQHWFFTVGGLIPVNSNFTLRPTLLGKFVKNAPFDVDINVTGIYNKKVHLGVGYRLGGDGAGESVGLSLMYQINQIGLGVAYDIGLSELSKSTSGSFELFARYDFEGESAEDLANPRYQF